MTANVGAIDRGVRIFRGVVVLSLFFLLEGDAWWWVMIGVLIGTDLIR